jgi:hypothetical protein
MPTTIEDVLAELKLDAEAGDSGVNLDAHSEPDWLRAFWLASLDRPEQLASLLYPRMPAGSWVAATLTKQLGEYAAMKALAIDLRLAGVIEDAQRCERRCDEIYAALPDWARSW